MRTVEAAVAGAITLIGIYLLFNSQQAGQVINAIASGSAKIISALQGRSIGV